MSRIHEAFAKKKQRIPEPALKKEGNPSGKPSDPGIVQLPPLLIDDSPASAEEFLCTYRNLRKVGPPGMKTLLLCGVEEDEVTANVTLNLCAAIARNGDGRVLFVEGNLHRPVLHRFHKGPRSDGLSELLADFKPLDRYLIPTSQAGLFALRAGGNGVQGGAGFDRAALEHVISGLASRFSFVVFDAPPVGTPPCLQLAVCVDGVLLVVNCGTQAAEVERAKILLERAQANVLGAVLNR